MSDSSDNACGYDGITSFDSTQIQTTHENGEYNGDATEVAKMMKNCITLCLNHAESRNKCVYQAIAHDQNKSSGLLRAKMQLLCGLNIPIGNKICTAVQVSNMHKQFLLQFHKMYNSEDEYLRAYATHCEEAIKAKKALAESTEFDEHTDMACNNLVDVTKNVQKVLHDTEKACEEQVVKLKVDRKDKEAKYKTFLQEAELFENYYQMAIEALEQKKFDLDLSKKI